MEPFEYLARQPGKGVRNALIDAFNAWLRVPDAETRAIKSIVSQLHNASLLVDDIEDGSRLRRGVPVAHHIYGTALTLNAANYAYFQALDACQRLGSPAATAAFTEEMLRLHRGQGLDIYWRDTVSCPTLDEYRAMVLDKTGGLFRLAVRLMAAFSPVRPATDYTPLVNALGLFFQIRDDYANLTSEEYARNKSYCEDLTEGKFSYPVVAAVRAAPGDGRLLHVLRRRTGDDAVKAFAVGVMREAGAFDATRRALRELEAEIAVELRRLGGNAVLEATLRTLHVED